LVHILRQSMSASIREDILIASGRPTAFDGVEHRVETAHVQESGVLAGKGCLRPIFIDRR
jgi:hypothetical protein